MNYIISPVTSFNDEEMLFETKVGLDQPGMPLYCFVCGPTEAKSRSEAERLVQMLTRYHSSNHGATHPNSLASDQREY